ncbi:hypothetical protein N5923_15645 [Erwiniaceae bacterium BAC15a-03b]|uniref:Uncharacterized protein n=1 Tax=Winslowiella arboricola TaxID=2978220 RepID=A0A9J6PTB4_9GAMM|nr:hypothetical protein [Winslowiella arboricola]MCU5774378.1 hypothetical protein [Winslowiella arboricola]MCU5778925.1 hypothetical protein [Winslowiella arboricola]
MQPIRLMGEGYEACVEQSGERLTWDQPVDSGFVSFSFRFEIRQVDVDVLLTDDYRRAVLETTAHALLQHSTMQGNARFSQSDFDGLVADTLHSTFDFLQAFIARVSREHHIAIDHYVKDILDRRSAAK